MTAPSRTPLRTRAAASTPLAGRWLVLLALAAIAWAAAPAHAKPIDKGIYRIYLNGRSMGSEIFYFDQFSDSLVVQSAVTQLVRIPDGGEDSLKKSCQLSVNTFDLDMRVYQSVQMFRGQKIARTLVMSDTMFSSYREINDRGSVDVLERPPGRLYVHDPDVYVLFDVIARNLNTQKFDSRPITLMVLGPSDTTLEVTATRKPPAPKKWGAKTLQSRAIELDDGVNRVVIWCDTRGRMIELEIPAAGLRVVRDAPDVKARPRG